MRKLISIIAAAAILIGICLSASARTNIAENGDFENGSAGWQTVSAQLNIVSDGGSGSCGEVVMNKEYGRAMNKVRFQKGVKYMVSVYVRLKEGRNTASLIADHRSFGDKQLIKAVVKDVKVSGSWTKLTGIYEWIGEGTGEANLYVRIGDAKTPVTFYMDNMSVEIYKGEIKSFKETVPNSGELFINTGFDETTEPFTANNSQISLFSGDGAEETISCARVNVMGQGSNIGQKIKLSPHSKYKFSAYVKSGGGNLSFSFTAVPVTASEQEKSKYITDYASDTENLFAAKKISAGNAGDKAWTLLSGIYEYNGDNECEAYVCLCPSADAGAEYFADKFSAVKTGGISINNDIEKNGFFVNNIPVSLKNGFEFSVSTAMMSAEEIADILGADFLYSPPLCTISKGLNTVTVNTLTGIESLNNRIIPAQKAYVKDGAVMTDISALCGAFGASVDIDDNFINITTGTESAALSHTAARLRENGKASVAFMGGAVAYGSGAGVRNETSYRSLVMAHIKNKYNDCEFEEINFSLGAVDSGTELYRAGEFMEKSPDLIFIDFVPEDCGRDADRIKKGLESLIYKIRSLKADTDIVFLASYTPEFEQEYKDGKTPEIIEIYNSVAEKYKIPIINTGLKLYDASQGKPSDNLLYSYYPNDAGHKIYADLICGFIDKSLFLPSEPSELKVNDISGITIGNILSVETAQTDSFETEDGSLRGSIGDELTFEFEGTEIGLLWNIGIDSGSVEYEIDGKNYDRIKAFDRLGVRSRHINYAMLAEGLENKKHILRLKVSDEKADMSLGNRIEINGFLVGVCK